MLPWCIKSSPNMSTLCFEQNVYSYGQSKSEISSVPDPDPGYGSFLTPGSGIQDRDPRWIKSQDPDLESGSGIWIQDENPE